ncbi:MAG TPA: DinB family protein [Gemmatimonadales bacterium]
MTFSNPAAGAPAAASAYVRALLDLLGARDPLDVAAELVAWLDRRLAGLNDAVLRRPESPGKWSVVEIVQHLADSELVLGWRTRLILTEDRPNIQGYDQDAWARALRYADVPLALAMDQLRATRAANLRIWRGLTPAERDRAGIHSERGPESLDRLIRLVGGHDLVHRRQIDRVLAAAGASP